MGMGLCPKSKQNGGGIPVPGAKGKSITFEPMRRVLRGLGVLAAAGWFLVVLLIVQIYYYGAIHDLELPLDETSVVPMAEREKVGDRAYRVGPNWIRRNTHGLHELYVEGGDYERGRVTGALTRELMEIQEQAFTDRIQEMIPSSRYLSLLKYLIAYMNRDLENYVSPSLKREIYGISQYSSSRFDWIGDPYARQLNYHAAHDIGHALQSLMLVGCTSFGVWDDQSRDGSLLVGRNFDFWVGDAFAEEKILAFVRPDSGYGFVSLTWGGFVGVVSGMNDQGLTVTLNAAPGQPSWKARTPVSLVAREILQYAADIEDALDIARRHPVFVSESFLIASARDGRAVVVEKTPDQMAVYSGEKGRIACTNFYQSEAFSDLQNNQKEMREGASAYRYARLEELLDRQVPLRPPEVADILRDRKGKGDQSIGWGNEKAINQFIAHHSIIFQPDSGRFWISTSPWQMGAFLCYDLKAVLEGGMPAPDRLLYDSLMTIEEDPMVHRPEMEKFLGYREALRAFERGEGLDTSRWLSLNPDYYETYEIAGDFARSRGWAAAARAFYRQALEKEIPRATTRRSIEAKLQEQ